MPELAPPLQWAGGKRWLVPPVRVLWQQHAGRRLVAPFCGGLALPLGLLPRQALLNDISPHLINFYRWLQAGLHSEFGPQDNDETLYYQRRARFNELIRLKQHGTMEAALLFYYLNRTGFNGLCRFNSGGFFNVPKGSYRHINYMQTDDFRVYRAVLADWEFREGDFEGLALRAGDFVYADPPYDVPFTQYARQGFNWQDQERLARWLAQHDGPVLLSNQATERIKCLYESYGFTVLELKAPRRISSSGDRTPALEVLAGRNVDMSELEQTDLQQTMLF